MNRCTLVTGATGFIGCHLVESLLKRRPGGRVVCLVRDQTPDSRFSRDGLA